MQNQSFFTKKIEEAEKAFWQLQVDLSTLFEDGSIPSENDTIGKLLELQRHLREAKVTLNELFTTAVDTRTTIEKELRIKEALLARPSKSRTLF
jgi:hypothetical protein